MRSSALILLAAASLAGFPLQEAKAATINLGTAGNFAVLGGQTVTNTGSSVFTGGHVGTDPGSSIVGFPPGMVSAPYTTPVAAGIVSVAQGDLTTAYNAAAALSPTQVLTGQDLGGKTLTPGVYSFAVEAQLTGALTLNNLGDPNALFVFQTVETLITASGSSVVMSDGGLGSNVFWKVGSSATLGAGTTFTGHILALTSITLNDGAKILGGSALTRNGAVTLISNTINNSVVPEPATLTLALLGGALSLMKRSSRRGR